MRGLSPRRLALAAALAAVPTAAVAIGVQVSADGGAGPQASPAVDQTPRGTVVLLHGLGRTDGSMGPLEDALAGAGYRVVNLGYPSRRLPVRSLADTVAVALDRCCAQDGPVHFVTHSLGGILVRAYRESHGRDRIGRVVMLSPPNQGSEVVDHIPDGLLKLVLGPAVLELGTDSASVPRSLPPVDFELGIITGSGTLNPLFSWWLPGEDDGKVSVESARVEGADEFLVVPYSHTWIMRRGQVIQQVLAFLESGAFDPAPGDTIP